MKRLLGWVGLSLLACPGLARPDVARPDVARPDVARADVTLPKVIGDNMVLQQQRPVPIWGDAAAGEKITVRFAGQEKSAVADAAGHWRVTLDAMDASATPRDMAINGSNTIHLSNVVVGEVWLCSGQSNMEFYMHRKGAFKPPRTGPDPIATDLAAPPEPGIRIFLVKATVKGVDVTTAGWGQASPQTLGPSSAVAYYFAKDLHRELTVPIGLLESTWGGQRIERFTPPSAYAAIPYFQVPSATSDLKIDNLLVGDIYQHMIQPLIPYALRGAIWYQGESNVMIEDDGPRYFQKMKALIDGWRTAWGQGDFSFFYVQLAPFKYAGRKDALAHSVQSLPKVWEGQTMALSLPNTGMAATIDITENIKDIHPPDKWDVGHRLALWALSKDYGRAHLVFSGPIYKSLQISGSTATVHFDSVGSGLVSSDGKPLREFQIAGPDGKFVPADAVIAGDTVVVSSPQVPAPAAVRFAWNETPSPNLSNRNALPAFPFRSDAPPIPR